MAKIVRTKFFKRQKKWEHFKIRSRSFILKVSILSNIYMSLHIYDPQITKILTNNIIEIYTKVAPIMESLINKLPL